MLKEFKEFAMRGNVLDLAIAVIIGAAFGLIVTSLVNDILMPPIGLLLGGLDFKDFFISLNNQSYPSLDAAKKAGAPVIAYGNSDPDLPHMLQCEQAVYVNAGPALAQQLSARGLRCVQWQ